MKWYLYWTGLVAFLLGLLYYKNTQTNRGRTREWNIGQTIVEGVLIILAAAFMPPILIIYGSMWLTRSIQRPVLKAGASFIVSTILMVFLGTMLEVLIVLGVLSVGMVSEDFLKMLKERRDKRPVNLQVA